MGKKTELINLPTRLLVVELGSKKRYKRILALSVMAGFVVGGAVVGVVHVADTRQAAALEGAWTDLNACLLGAPLKEGETPAVRVANVQLAVLGTPKDRRAKPGETPWPSSCAPAAFALADHAGGAPEKGEALAESAQALAKALKDDAGGTTDLAPIVEKLWADATASKLKMGASPRGPAAPAPASPVFTPEAFAALPKLLSGNFTMASVHPPASLGTGKLYFVVEQDKAAGGPMLCGAGAADAVLECTPVPAGAAKLSPGVRLAGTLEDKAMPFFFAGDRGQFGVFPPDGRDAVAQTVAYGALGRADGSLLLLVRSPARDLRLAVHRPVGPPTESFALSTIEADNPNAASLFWDWLVYRSPGRGGPPHLFAKKLGPLGLEPGSIDIGEIEEVPPGEQPALAGCRSDEIVAVRVRGQRTDLVTLHASGRWSAPFRAATRGGTLTCHGLEAVTTQIAHTAEGGKSLPTVTQSRCALSGCTTATIAFREVLGGTFDIAPPDAGSFAAADVGGKLLAVWSAGYIGGLRMRLAPPDRFKDTEDVVIADARGKDKMSAVTEVKIVPAPSFAIVLVGTTTGVRALKVDASGAVTAAAGAR